MCESICQEEKEAPSTNVSLQPQMVFFQWCVALASLVQIDAIEGCSMEPNQKLLVESLQCLGNVGGHIESVDICGNLEVFFSRRQEKDSMAVFASLRSSLLPG